MVNMGNTVTKVPLDSTIHLYHLVGGAITIWKNMTSSIGMMSFPIYGKIKFMFQTTNQYNKQVI
jgi:hypothetical protein